jgi:TetR/AcrR family transcriptional regulator, transcriptional repressor for nem operon
VPNDRLPSDVACSNPEVRAAYQELLTAMVGLFETSLEDRRPDAHQMALVLAALCVGGMILARTLPDSTLAEDIRKAALQEAQRLTQESTIRANS